jgi:hypothetical protein
MQFGCFILADKEAGFQLYSRVQKNQLFLGTFA